MSYFDRFVARRENLDNELRLTYAQTISRIAALDGASDKAMRALATDMKINGGERGIDDHLVAIAERLGVSLPEMKLDADAVHEAALLQKAMPSEAAMAQACKARATAAESLIRMREENQRALARADAEFKAAYEEERLLDNARRDSQVRITQLHRERPRAFGLQPPP